MITIDIDWWLVGNPYLDGVVLALLLVWIVYRGVKLITSIPWGSG